MNLFSFAGDLLHLCSIVIILLKIYTQKTCRGEQRQTEGRERTETGKGKGGRSDAALLCSTLKRHEWAVAIQMVAVRCC